MNDFHDVRPGFPLTDVLPFGSDDDAVECLLRQCPIDGHLSGKGCKLQLSVQHVATEQIVVLEEQLRFQSSLQRRRNSLAMNG